MPVSVIAHYFASNLVCPTKELHVICGLLLLGELRNWTIEQTANAWCFDATVQYALKLPRDHQHISERTGDSYRQLKRESEVAQKIFKDITDDIVQSLKLNIKIEHLDSTHICSDIARFGRVKLLAVAVKRFLTQMLRHDPETYHALPEELRQRYQPSKNRLFSMGSKTADRPRKPFRKSPNTSSPSSVALTRMRKYPTFPATRHQYVFSPNTANSVVREPKLS